MRAPSVHWTRREALSWGALGVGALALGSGISCSRLSSRPRSVIFLVSDGMSAGVPALAEAFSQLNGKKETFWHKFSRDRATTHGLFDMASLDSLVTDSAAAASAWGSGQRVQNRAINQFPDGTQLKALGLLLKEQGLATGLVSTARITHATPAGFCATVAHRDHEDKIALQYLEQIDVLLGGGDLHFKAESRQDGRDLISDYSQAGYEVLRSRDALLSVSGKRKLLGLFAAEHLPYSIDRNQDSRLQSEVPTLAEMTSQALAALNLERKGFFLMVEAARVDHAAHANDAAGIIYEQLAFDETLAVVEEFQKANPDTLVIISSDHGNANPGLNGIGAGYAASTGSFQRISEVKMSASKIRQTLTKMFQLDKNLKPEEIMRVIQEKTGFEMNVEEALILRHALAEKVPHEVSAQQKNFYAQLGQILGNWHGVGWTGVTHTSDWTLAMSRGPGQQLFSGLMKNTDFFDKILDLFAISYRNPTFAGGVETLMPEKRGVADPTG
jgi:alkaline phosphatase